MTERQPVIHSLKCESEYFDAQKSGRKTWELRRNDRNYIVGDILRLQRSSNGSFGKDPEIFRVRVTYVLESYKGLQPGYCILSTAPDDEGAA